MKRTILVLASIAALAVSACDEGVEDTTNGRRGPARSSSSTAGSEDSTFDHSNDPGGAAPGVPFEPPDPAQAKAVGSPELTARLHGCGKLSVTSIGDILTSRGLTGGGPVPRGALSGKAIFDRPDSAAALGAANYNGRVPEAPFASTSAISKMYDIFAMAAYDATEGDWQAPACPDVKLLGDDGEFTRDGISCLIGRPATDEHVAIANDAIAKNPTDSAKIAIAALLSAAHTCQ